MDSEKLPNTDLHQVVKMTIFNIQVCSLASEDDALAWVRDACPAGTAKNWQKPDEEDLRPVACVRGGGRTHYIFMA